MRTTGISAGEPEQLFETVAPLSETSRVEWKCLLDSPIVSSWTTVPNGAGQAIRKGNALTASRVTELIGRSLDASDFVVVSNGDPAAAPTMDVLSWGRTSDGGLDVTTRSPSSSSRLRVQILYHVP